MMRFELQIVGTIPDGNDDIGAEAQVSTREPAHAIVEALHKLGLLHVSQTRRLVRKKDTATPAAPRLVQPAAE